MFNLKEQILVINDFNGQNIAIQLKGNPIYSGNNDIYYNIDAAGSRHPPLPQLWLCYDTYFEVSASGVKYISDQTPVD